MINKEIKNAKASKEASIILKLNSLSDADLIEKLYEAAQAGVVVKMIVRGIFCAVVENSKFKRPISAISIVDEYLEHARILIFHNDGKEKVFISSADWMVRNLDHRVEAAIPVTNKDIIKELKDIISIQLQDNVKARWLDKELSNNYVETDEHHKVRSQIEIYNYLQAKTQHLEDRVPEPHAATTLT
jgi:polyphosphate kinase